MCGFDGVDGGDSSNGIEPMIPATPMVVVVVDEFCILVALHSIGGMNLIDPCLNAVYCCSSAGVIGFGASNSA